MTDHTVVKRWLKDNPFEKPTLPEGYEEKFGREGVFRYATFEEATNKRVKAQYQDGDEIWLWVCKSSGAAVLLIRENSIVMEDALVCF